jgi:hypothetical protein
MPQHLVTGAVAMRVIDALEVIHIEHQQAGKAALALRPVQRLLRTQDQEATVGQLDQRVHPAEPLQLTVLRFDPRASCQLRMLRPMP